MISPQYQPYVCQVTNKHLSAPTMPRLRRRILTVSRDSVLLSAPDNHPLTSCLTTAMPSHGDRVPVYIYNDHLLFWVVMARTGGYRPVALFSKYWNGSIYLSSLWRGKQSSDRYITLTERFWVTRHRSIPETVLSTCYLYILGPSGDRRPDGHPLSHLHPDILFYHHLSNPFTSFPASTSTTTIPPAELTAAFVPARFSSSLNCAYHSVVCSFSKSSKLLLLSTNVSGTLLVPFVLLSIAPL